MGQSQAYAWISAIYLTLRMSLNLSAGIAQKPATRALGKPRTIAQRAARLIAAMNTYRIMWVLSLWGHASPVAIRALLSQMAPALQPTSVWPATRIAGPVCLPQKISIA